jgi:parallel beta-helix repeat protein
MTPLIVLLASSSLLWGVLGSDAATRTIGPGQDLTSAVGAMQPGDTLVLESGTYPAGPMHPPSGTSGAPTTITAAPGAQPVLVPATGAQDTFFDFQGSAHDVVLDGLTMDGQGQVAFPVYGAPDVHNLTLQYSTIRHARQSGMLVGGTQWTLAGNQFLHNGTKCCATHSDDHGVYFSASDSRIVGNTFADNACNNLQIYGGSDPSNNVVEDNRFTGSKCGVALTSGRHQTFRNNTLIHDGTTVEHGLVVKAPGSQIDGNRLQGVTMWTEGAVQAGRNGGEQAGAQVAQMPQPPQGPAAGAGPSQGPSPALRVLPVP